MPKVKLTAKLPQGQANGLLPAADKFIDDPDTQRIAVVLLDTRQTIEDRDDGDITAVVRVRRVELIVRGDDVDVLKRIMLRAHEDRTGQPVLPFDTELAINDVFDTWSKSQDPKPDENGVIE